MPNLGSKGYQAYGMTRIINDYKNEKGNTISDDMNDIFIKISQMESALKEGQKYKKEVSKAKDKLENN